MNFVLGMMRSHWRDLSRKMTQSDYILKEALRQLFREQTPRAKGKGKPVRRSLQ